MGQSSGIWTGKSMIPGEITPTPSLIVVSSDGKS